MQKIMVVDDEEIYRYITKTMLENDYDVVCASSGEEALSVFDKENPQLVITDLLMPHMSGFELQKKFKDKYGSGVPMIFMTSDEREEQETMGFRVGAADYIHKPCSKDILLSRVGRVFDNIQHMKNLEAEARTDLLTGLYNKSYAESEITECCKHRSGVLMVIDLDSFKLVNDLVGHDAGDEVLVSFAGILKTVIRNKDVVGRIGGDEFIIFCNNIKDKFIIDAKTKQLNRMLKAEAERILGNEVDIPLGVSVGAVFVPAEGTEYGELFKKADKALYQVKQNGKHSFCLFQSDDAKPLPDINTNVKNSFAVLDERGEPSGSYEVSNEAFTTVYRYLKRSIFNYNSLVQFGIITLNFAEGIESDRTEEIMDAFAGVLRSSMRFSDVFTRKGKNQFWLLIPESNREDSVKVVLDRILNKWAGNTESQNVTVTYDIETIKCP
ncbi:diguanylate cyclase [Butyrivibrio sp. INlla16]|uniref:diguanylate cyclase domain-containing protein n=1 Tax=Butyrivibrio sp. INlla16 TaxID=1520807 RepID=UPI00088F58D3|nr:diguanylate cyclase [Butyrivibrio sp. INlla16]SDB68527.1 diguanylate cyclase (GGDEF) domain-containing protein [Butyrivibrio sp. INlla16]